MSIAAACLCSVVVAAALLASLAAATPVKEWGGQEGGEPISYGRDVRPILANNCFKCHGPDPEVRQARLRLDTADGPLVAIGDGRPAVVAGHPEKSLLIELVTSPNPDERMPPVDVKPHGLTPDEVDTLRRWIAAGAPWERHWSFVAPEKKPAPAVRLRSWPRNDLDRWVLAALEREHLAPSEEASRQTLIRRLSLDLIGLPPTPAEIDAFLADKSDDAYERVVDRLLASPRFGEKWARWWLDMARYADTKGYEKDDRRTVWPYRDWLIRALNADMPFDRFTIEQLAGDMLPDATRDQIIATAFHRNTMTNDEGGTDDEEFRVAAVIDRVNTTMEVWQGLTIACAQCHTHKYDPMTHSDYFRVFALLNNTEDADRAPETPFLRIVKPEAEARIAALDAQITAHRSAIDAIIAAVPDESFSSVDLSAPTPLDAPADRPWLDDATPAGAKLWMNDVLTPWPWTMPATPDGAQPQSGARAFRTTYPGTGQVFVTEAMPRLAIAPGEKLYAYAYLDPKDPPKAIMLQWLSVGKGWSHRAYWGGDQLPWAKDLEGTANRLRLGDLPPTGRWVRLEVDAKAMNLEGDEIQGWAFSQHGGTVTWDNAGVVSARAIDDRYRRSLSAWAALERDRKDGALPQRVRAVVDALPSDWTDEQLRTVRDYYLRNVHLETIHEIAPHDTAIASAMAERARLEADAVSLPIMRELAGDKRRVTHRFERGSFLSPAEEVSPGTPEEFADVSPTPPHDRLEFARWLMSETNPLTARVIANRLWEQLWGIGIVETVEDFGTQGAWPSNQGLLDHLALRLRSEGWSVKKFLRYVVTSATYRQSSDVSAELLSRDPANHLLARGARVRLDGEVIRDQALAAAGLLSDTMYGPPVFPPQPDGLWIMIYSNDHWATSKGSDRYRRSLYTFWRRTVPHPAMTTFDAPSREFCVSRRIRTNTPLQAFVTLNDPQFVECAQAMARRVLRDAGPTDAARISHAFRLAVARAPKPDEQAELARLLASLRKKYHDDTVAATLAATDPLGPLPDALDPTDAAAWTALCAVILNLDETLTRE